MCVCTQEGCRCGRERVISVCVSLTQKHTHTHNMCVSVCRYVCVCVPLFPLYISCLFVCFDQTSSRYLLLTAPSYKSLSRVCSAQCVVCA